MQHFCSGYSTHGKIGTPEERRFGYQLPSPLEDEMVLDPTMADKEVCLLSPVAKSFLAELCDHSVVESKTESLNERSERERRAD